MQTPRSAVTLSIGRTRHHAPAAPFSWSTERAERLSHECVIMHWVQAARTLKSLADKEEAIAELEGKVCCGTMQLCMLWVVGDAWACEGVSVRAFAYVFDGGAGMPVIYEHNGWDGEALTTQLAIMYGHCTRPPACPRVGWCDDDRDWTHRDLFIPYLQPETVRAM